MTLSSSIDYSALYKITYGLYIISSKKSDKLSGYISNTVMQVTSDPVQFAVCCNKNNYTAGLIHDSKTFSISALQKDTKDDMIRLFGYNSGRDVDKFEKVNYLTGLTGVPIVTEDTIVWFECELVQTYDVGSHLVFIGKTIKGDTIDINLEPLTYSYYREVKKGVAPKNAPTYIDISKISKSEPQQARLSKYECQVCGYVYDPDDGDSKSGIPGGTAFEDLPDNWLCPVCGTRKSDFEKIN